jgi:hypothetical protein
MMEARHELAQRNSSLYLMAFDLGFDQPLHTSISKKTTGLT